MFRTVIKFIALCLFSSVLLIACQPVESAAPPAVPTSTAAPTTIPTVLLTDMEAVAPEESTADDLPEPEVIKIPDASVRGAIREATGTPVPLDIPIIPVSESISYVHIESEGKVHIVNRTSNGDLQTTSFDADSVGKNADGSTEFFQDDTSLAKINSEGELELILTIENPTVVPVAAPEADEAGDEVGVEMPSLEELTVETALSIDHVEQITGQQDFLLSISNRYKDLEISENVKAIEISKTGEVGVGGNYIIYGLDNGVVLAIYDIEANKLEHAVGGNKFIENGTVIELPFNLFMITSESILDRYNDKFVGYNYSEENPYINNITDAQQSVVKTIFRHLVLSQNGRWYHKVTNKSNGDHVVKNMNTEQRVALMYELESTFLENIANGKEATIQGLTIDPSTKNIIIRLNHDLTAKWSKTSFTGVEGNTFLLDLPVGNLDESDRRYDRLGGALLTPMSLLIVHDDWLHYTSQHQGGGPQASSNYIYDMTWMAQIAMYGTDDKYAILKWIKSVPGQENSTWNLPGLPTSLSNPANFGEVYNPMRIPKYLRAITID